MLDKIVALPQLIKHFLFMQKLQWMTPRNLANYNLFLNLYSVVGYAPKGEISFSNWEGLNLIAWQNQGRLISGNCIGGLYGNKLALSAATMLISKNILYGHSPYICL